jgi:serine/threonine-protein kinase
VHRDLKPDNIMVSTARGKDTVKVVDFGIAKAIGGEDGKAQKVTKTGFVVGTPEYMSPEQLAGDPVDGRSDLYSLGLVFYRMLTGASPFPADSQQETMIKRLTDDPLPLAVARPDVTFPAEVQRVFDRALARNPNDRYRAASDFARDVRGLSTHATGQVDVEAGTQKVRAEDLKAAMPATRVDPAAGAVRPKAPPGTEKLAARPTKKGVPVLPVTIAVLVFAVGGGILAMRDRLFGGGTATPDSMKAEPATDTGGTQQFAHADTTGRSVDTARAGQKPPPVTTTPTGTEGRRDSVIRPPSGGYPTVPTGGKVTAGLPALEEIFEQGTRNRAREEARTIYNRSDVLDSVRAEAASLVGQAFNEDGNFREAKKWFGLAVALHPRKLYQNLLADAEQNLQRTGN